MGRYGVLNEPYPDRDNGDARRYTTYCCLYTHTHTQLANNLEQTGIGVGLVLQASMYTSLLYSPNMRGLLGK